jgi:hypothetical protein
MSYSYIAKKECGCIVMACVDDLAHRRDTAKEVAKAIREGYIVERVTVDYVRKHWFCPQHEAEHITKTTIQRLKGFE